MTKRELVANVARTSALPINDAERVVDQAFRCIVRGLRAVTKLKSDGSVAFGGISEQARRAGVRKPGSALTCQQNRQLYSAQAKNSRYSSTHGPIKYRHRPLVEAWQLSAPAHRRAIDSSWQRTVLLRPPHLNR